jgi:hypothetical protein
MLIALNFYFFLSENVIFLPYHDGGAEIPLQYCILLVIGRTPGCVVHGGLAACHPDCFVQVHAAGLVDATLPAAVSLPGVALGLLVAVSGSAHKYWYH